MALCGAVCGGEASGTLVGDALGIRADSSNGAIFASPLLEAVTQPLASAIDPSAIDRCCAVVVRHVLLALLLGERLCRRRPWLRCCQPAGSRRRQSSTLLSSDALAHTNIAGSWSLRRRKAVSSATCRMHHPRCCSGANDGACVANAMDAIRAVDFHGVVGHGQEARRWHSPGGTCSIPHRSRVAIFPSP